MERRTDKFWHGVKDKIDGLDSKQCPYTHEDDPEGRLDYFNGYYAQQINYIIRDDTLVVPKEAALQC